MISTAIQMVEREMDAALREVRMTSDAHAIATARYMALVHELVALCEAQQSVQQRDRRGAAKALEGF